MMFCFVCFCVFWDVGNVEREKIGDDVVLPQIGVGF